jgi:hypothetical protein
MSKKKKPQKAKLTLTVDKQNVINARKRVKQINKTLPIGSKTSISKIVNIKLNEI